MVWRTSVIIGLMLWGVALASAVAQDTTWSIWLYENTNGQLLRVNQDGEVEDSLSLPISDNLVLQGNTLAYTVTVNNTPTVVLYSLVTNTTLAEWHLPTPLMGAFNADDRLVLTPLSLDAEARYLAFSYRLGGQGWAIVVLDAQNGDTLNTLNWQDALVQPFAALHAGVVPLVQAVYGLNNTLDSLDFAIDNDLGNPNPRQRSYVWYPSTQALYETVTFPSPSEATLLSRHEHLSALPDSRFEATNEAYKKFHFLQTNSVHVSTQDARFPFYTDPTLDIQQVYFIQNGERVLVTAYLDEFNTIWVILERDGHEVDRLIQAGDAVMGVRDGFVYLTTAANKTALVHVNTRDQSASTTVWVKDGNWRLVASDFTPLASVRAWAQLADEVHSWTDVVAYATPTRYPTPQPFLRVGMDAQIQAEEDHFINLRETPSTGGAVLALLESGARVTIVGGSVDADGYTWWNIRVGQREGWIVERVDDLQALISRQPSVETTPTATATP